MITIASPKYMVDQCCRYMVMQPVMIIWHKKIVWVPGEYLVMTRDKRRMPTPCWHKKTSGLGIKVTNSLKIKSSHFETFKFLTFPWQVLLCLWNTTCDSSINVQNNHIHSLLERDAWRTITIHLNNCSFSL